MTRKSATMLLAVIALWARPAFAQSTGTAGSGSTVTNNASGTVKGNITVLLSKVGTTNFDSTRPHPLGLDDCINKKLTVSLSNLPNSVQYPYLEVWWATGTSMCEAGDRGSRTPSTNQCTKLTHNKEDQKFNALTTAAVEVEFRPVCQLNAEQTGGSDGKKEIYFILLSSKGSSEAATFYGSLNFDLDLSPPPVPAITEHGSGMTDIRLAWSQSTGGDTGIKYWVAADWSQGALMRDGGAATTDNDGGIANTECPSNYLVKGYRLDPEARPTGLFVKDTTATEYSFTAENFHGATLVPAAVVAQDLAGNVSALSEVVCLKVEPTTGFWGLYKQGDGGTASGLAEPGCACSAPGAHSRRFTTLTILPVALLLAGGYARRRIRRRAR
jgi:MYXO-CTERM domain-containing protein